MKEPADIVPNSSELTPVILRVLADGKERHKIEVAALVADYLNLSAAVRTQRTKTGALSHQCRVFFKMSDLTNAGLLERTATGVYRITENGREVDRRDLTRYTLTQMREWPTFAAHKEEVAQRRLEKGENTSDNDDSEDPEDPIEAMTVTEQNFNAEVETALRKRLQEASPQFFERAVIDLLWAMGYGGTHGEKRHVGRSGDGGIDGIIRQDALGLTNVYIQAKRYSDSNKVGEPDVRNFIGSLDARGANLGVFITTSSFQPSAVRRAAGYRHGTIILIDGIKLTSLMLSYGIAVHKSHEFTLYKIDDDFFDEESA